MRDHDHSIAQPAPEDMLSVARWLFAQTTPLDMSPDETSAASLMAIAAALIDIAESLRRLTARPGGTS